MVNFLGEYYCKIDNKGRVMFPAALKKQVPTEAQERFVINRGLEKCLTLYPKNVWDQKAEEINNLNEYVEINRRFKRNFLRGATEIILDSANRFIIPKKLAEYAGINKDVVLATQTDKIEIWDSISYENQFDDNENISAMAEIVLGNKQKDDNTDQ